MPKPRLRSRIADEAAKLIVTGRESDYTTAKRRAARILGVRFTTRDFPTTREVRDACQRIESLSEGGHVVVDLHRMRVAALRLLRALRPFSPKLVGPVAEGSVRTGAETRIDVEADCLADVVASLSSLGLECHVAEPEKAAAGRVGVLLVQDGYAAKICVFPKGTGSFGLTEQDLGMELAAESDNLEAELEGLDAAVGRFEVLEDLLTGLESIPQNPVSHPEGDALYHSLQVYDLAKSERDFDEEFLTAALFHDVGKLTQSPTPMRESQSLLAGLVTRRVLALIRGMELALLDPPATRAEIEAAVGKDNVEDALHLADLDRAARQPGVAVSSVADAIAHLRELDRDEDGN